MAALRPLALSVRAKLTALVALPLVVLTGLSTYEITDAAGERARDHSLVELATLSTLTTSLVHSLQAERGATNTYLASKGAKMADKLPGLRQSTSSAKTALREYLADGHGVAAAVLTSSTDAVAAFDSLDATRTKADALALPGPEAVAYYTKGIGALLGSLSTFADQAVSIAGLVEQVAGDAAGAQRASDGNGETAGRLARVANELDTIVGRFHFSA